MNLLKTSFIITRII